jgi:predicted transposase YbfD/YdcC
MPPFEWVLSPVRIASLCFLINPHFQKSATITNLFLIVYSIETCYYISSAKGTAAFFNRAVRTHWRIENSAHWVLDMAFREDESRLRKDNGAENMATLRRMALSLLKQDKTVKLGIKNKRLKATWDHDYLIRLLTLMMN